MARRKKLYEGKAKIIYQGPEPDTVVQYFKDDATAFNNVKKGTIEGKGVLNNRISSFLMSRLSLCDVPTHFIKRINMREQLVHHVEIVPVEVIIRNYAAGSFAKRFKLEEGGKLPRSIVEYCYKSDDLGDPIISEDHVFSFGLASPYELEEIYTHSLRINDILTGLFMGIGIRLVDFKLEFGRIFDEHGNSFIVLADEISPDTCRLWDLQTEEKMDKDRFRRDMGKVEEAYQEVARRLGLLNDNGQKEKGQDPKTTKAATRKKKA